MPAARSGALGEALEGFKAGKIDSGSVSAATHGALSVTREEMTGNEDAEKLNRPQMLLGKVPVGNSTDSHANVQPYRVIVKGERQFCWLTPWVQTFWKAAWFLGVCILPSDLSQNWD